MNTRCISILPAVVAIAIGGCAGMHPGETKVRLDQTPAAVRQAIERELAGAQLEDIAKEQRQDQTVYETDIVRDGHKWEVVVGEDGTILSKIQEGGRVEENS